MYSPAHPGEILKELYIENLDLTITEVADALGVTRKTLSGIVNQRSGISPEMSLRLSQAFPNTDPQYWMNLQVNYDLWKVTSKSHINNIRVLLNPKLLGS
jgi:addiction module HigA family antidote